MNLPFEGDTFIKAELIKLRDRFGLTSCVETGTQYGSTTLELYNIFGRVVTIEKNLAMFNEAINRFISLNMVLINIVSVNGDSKEVLESFDEEPCLYYLDAHSNGECPLKEELSVISGKNDGRRQCIAIHDFKVPGTDFGYDTYDYELCFEEIEPYLKVIYPGGFDYHYNTQADGAKRGIVFIYPKIKK